MKKLSLALLLCFCMAFVFAADYVISNQVLVSTDDFSVTIVGPSDDPYDSGFKILVENKSSKELNFQMGEGSIGDVSIGLSFYVDVQPGKKAVDVMSIGDQYFGFWGIEQIDELSFKLSVIDSAMWFFGGSVYENYFTIYPTGLSAETAPAIDISFLDKGDVALDNDDFKLILFYGDEYGDYFGPGFMAVCQNKTDKSLLISFEDVTIDGASFDSYWANVIPSGKYGFYTMTFERDDMASWGITELDEVSFTLSATEMGLWYADELCGERITVYPTGLPAGSVKPVSYIFDPNDVVLVDNDDVLVVLLRSRSYMDSFWGEFKIPVYVENRRDSSINVSWDDVSVNDYMLDPYFGATVQPGRVKIESATFGSYSLGNASIKEVKTVEFSLRVMDDEYWDNLFEDSFKVEF